MGVGRQLPRMGVQALRVAGGSGAAGGKPRWSADVDFGGAFGFIVLGGVGSLWGAGIAGLMGGMVVGLSAAFASEWSLMSMYLLCIAVVTFRARGLFGRKIVLDT